MVLLPNIVANIGWYKLKNQIKEINELENQIKKNSQISNFTVNNFIFDSLNSINN